MKNVKLRRVESEGDIRPLKGSLPVISLQDIRNVHLKARQRRSGTMKSPLSSVQNASPGVQRESFKSPRQRLNVRIGSQKLV